MHDILSCHGLQNFDVAAVSDTVPKSFLLPLPEETRKYQMCLRFTSSSILFKILKKLPLIESAYVYIRLPWFRKRLLKILKTGNYQAVFMPLRGEVMLLMEKILAKNPIPLYTMIEDTIEREIDGHRPLFKAKKKAYEFLLKNSVRSLGVASEAARDYFKENYQFSPVILRPSYHSFAGEQAELTANTINIFFSGNLYARKEFDQFLNAIDLVGSQNPQLKITFYVASHVKVSFKPQSFQLVNLGWVSEETLKEYMSKCHIAYLPYKSESEFKHSMMYAFPGKAGLYISSGLPIFFHGPEYSSFNVFLKSYEVGVSCDRMNVEELARAFEDFLENEGRISVCKQECERAFESEFSRPVFDKRVQLFFKAQNSID